MSLTGKGLIVGSSNLTEISQRPDGCNLTVTVLGSQYEGICLDHRIGKGSKHLTKYIFLFLNIKAYLVYYTLPY